MSKSSIEDVDVGMSGVMVVGGKEREKGLATKGKCEEMSVPYAEPGEVEQERWKKIIEDHKECVTEFLLPFSEESHLFMTDLWRSAIISSRSHSRLPSPPLSAIFL